jgi:NAD(P)-dependent dehydrogenase (short-subunit alcohol dehydrogenase family)
MDEYISLKDRVAVVTGAGRGLGKAYVELLAERGAQVVVNDLGTDPSGAGNDSSVAKEVVEQIIAAGGQAISDGNDVSTPAGGQAIVDRAVREFGGVDILVNNAGICGNQPFLNATLEDFEHYWRIHLGGHVNLCKAVWPLMIAQNRGRIIMTESGAGLYGLAGQATYAAAKGAVHGLMRTLALEGAEHGILVNSVAPGGFTRLQEAAVDDPDMLSMLKESLAPELVAPAIVWLASDECRANGQVISAWNGRVVRTVIGAGTGLRNLSLTPDTVLAGYESVTSTDSLYEPRDALDDVATWLGRWDLVRR